MHNLPFDYRKAVQAINYFARANGGVITKLDVLKLIFFSDRYHLRKYGRPITNDQYWAMQFGPVASAVKEMAELDSLCGTERHYAERVFQKATPEYHLQSISPVDEDVFSDSDLEALAYVWTNFGSKRMNLVNITHKYPEWKKHEAALAGGMSRVRMDLADFLDDPENNVDPCWPLTPEERQARREALGHLHQIESLWR